MVFATRKEIRKYCPRYRSLQGEGILDFNTDCTSGQLEPGDTALVRRLVMLDAFRQLMRALALPGSPLRRKFSRRKRP
jgi:hypothetical protein